MDNNQEIARIAKVLYGHYCGNDKCGECKQPNCMDYIRATHLVNDGIGDKKQAVKEAFDKLKEKTKTLSDMPRILFNSIIDELFAEIYGKDD